MKKRLFAWLLTLCMLIGLVPATAITASAASQTITYTISYNNKTRYWLNGSDGSSYNIGSGTHMNKTYTATMGDVTIVITSADDSC